MPTKPRWIEFQVRVPFEYVEPVAELFRRFGKGGVAIEEIGSYNPDEGESRPERPDAILRTYMPKTPGYRSNREMVHIGIDLISRITLMEDLVERELGEDEWERAWKAHFTPLRIGARIVVRPPWNQITLQKHDVVVEIDPGLAFGTGHHPTTRRVLESIERLLIPGQSVLDVGAGSGILTVAAVKLGASRVIGVELDKIALRVGRANLRTNGVSGKARFYLGTLPHPRATSKSADLVVANINSVALVNLASHLQQVIKPGGWLIAAGILIERQDSVESAFADVSLDVKERIYDGDWVALICQTAN